MTRSPEPLVISIFSLSPLLRFVLDETDDIKIVNFDALTYAGNLENLLGIDNGRHEFVKGDIRNPKDVLAALPGDCNAIFNFAAESHVDRSIDSANEFLTTNIIGTQLLLDTA